MKAIKFFLSLETFLEKTINVSVVLVFACLISVGFAAVVYRYVFQGGIVWSDEFLKQLVLWIALLGATVAAKDDAHIRIDIVPIVLKGSARKILETAGHLAAAVICAFLCRGACQFVSVERQIEEVTCFMGWPVWILVVVMPISFGLISMYFGLHAIRKLATLLKEESQ